MWNQDLLEAVEIEGNLKETHMHNLIEVLKSDQLEKMLRKFKDNDGHTHSKDDSSIPINNRRGNRGGITERFRRQRDRRGSSNSSEVYHSSSSRNHDSPFDINQIFTELVEGSLIFTLNNNF